MSNPARPLSPHLQIYRWQVQMVSSILHRATGVILALGSLLVVAGLLALAGGEAHWTRFTECAGSWFGKLVLFGWTWAFAYHLCNGIRHLIQDAGHGYAIASFVRNSWSCVIASILLTIAIWALAFAGGGA